MRSSVDIDSSASADMVMIFEMVKRQIKNEEREGEKKTKKRLVRVKKKNDE